MRDGWGLIKWPRQQESNLHLALRRGPFYPLNYGEDGVGILNSSMEISNTGERGWDFPLIA